MREEGGYEEGAFSRLFEKRRNVSRESSGLCRQIWDWQPINGGERSTFHVERGLYPIYFLHLDAAFYATAPKSPIIGGIAPVRYQATK